MEVDEATNDAIAELERHVNRIRPLLLEKRRPFFIEFAGTPKSGKTLTLSVLQQFLKRNGISVRVYQERASIAPLTNKGAASFNIWVTCATLNGMIEALEDEKLDVFILDRGLFDGLVWIEWQEKTLRLTREEADTFRNFILAPRWWDLIDLICVLHCGADQALVRENAYQITLKGGAIMNPTTLNQLRSHLLNVVEKYKRRFREHLVINTTSSMPRDSVMQVAKKTLETLEHFADEEVLCVPKSKLSEVVGLPFETLVQPQWGVIYSLVNESGRYVRRSKAETEEEWIQIVPVCVIEHSGKLLTNVRSEPGESLDKALANWAGGHVRKQDLGSDASKWSSVIAGLRREVLEELSIAQLPTPEPLGLVHTAENARAARHLGIVFRVHLDDPATAEALDNKIIREPPNKSVRTTWMDRDQLSAQTQNQKDWSRAINQHLFGSET